MSNLQNNSLNQNIVVVGGGISGLYLCYHLVKKGYTNLTLVEKDNIFGGRMVSEEIILSDYTKVSIEGGAGVIRDTDDLMITLLNELNISTNFWTPSPTSLVYVADTEIIESYGSKELLSKICDDATSDKTLLEVVKTTNISELDKIMFLIGTSYGELFESNALNTCKENNWDEFLYVEHEYGKPKEWSEVTNVLIEMIKGKTNLLLGHKVIEVTTDYILVDENGNNLKIKYDKLLITPPVNQLQKIKFSKPFTSWFSLMNNIQFQIDYLRVYCLLDKPLKLDSKICTNLDIRRVIPITDRVIMGVYTDGEDASKIHEIIKRSKDEGMMYIEEQLRKIIPISKVERIWEFYWSKGICGWKPTSDPLNEYMKYINHPLDNVYFCGDGYSMHTGWLEGALESCEDVLSTF